MTTLALIFTLSAIGISETAYLIRTRVAAKKPFCVIGEDCAKVLTSRYSKILFVPNDILGFLFYVAICIASALLAIGVPPADLWSLALKILVGTGSAALLFLMVLQWKVIKAWCFWCVTSAITFWLMGIILLLSPMT